MERCERFRKPWSHVSMARMNLCLSGEPVLSALVSRGACARAIYSTLRSGSEVASSEGIWGGS